MILGFCNLAAIWLETQAAQEHARARKGERKDIICIYMHFLFLFSYILYLKIYRMYVYVGLELVGPEDIEQNLNASPPAVFRNRGYLPTHHLTHTHIAHVCVCVYHLHRCKT